MSREARMLKRKNRIYKRIAVALTVALLTGQSYVFVLAEESAGEVPQTEISSGETGADNQSGNVDSQSPEDQQDGEDGADKCVCGTKCAEDAVNTECPVCAAGYANCAGKSDDEGNDDSGNSNTGDNDTENDDTENNDPENNGQDNTNVNTEGTTDGQDQCVCETACTEDTVNADCPVCAAGYANCAKNAGVNPSGAIGAEEAVSQNALSEEAGTALTQDEGMETYAADGTIWDDGSHLWYRVTGNGEVEVKGEDPNQDNSVENVIIPESFVKDGVAYRVTGIGASAFEKSHTLKTVSIPASVERIGDNAFASSYLSDATIAEGVTEIGKNAFGGCALESITIPGSVRSMGEEAFACADGLKSVTIKEGVESIGNNAFLYCSSLTRVEIPGSVTSIGDGAFSMCSRLTSVTIPAGVTEIKETAFAWSGLTNVEIPQGVTKIETAVFEGCKKLTRVTIPESVTNIKKNAFFQCESLTVIEMPQNVTEIGEAAFYSCKKLTGVEIPQGVTRIENYTFKSCTSLNNVEIPGNVTSIGDGAFEACGSLASVTISEKISKIGVEAFKDCDQLKALDIVVSSDGKIQFPQVGKDAFAPFPDNNKVNKRYIHFFDTFDTSKNELRGQAYTDAFTEAAQNDGDSDNGRWYGWSYEGVTIDTYTVTFYDGTTAYGADTPQKPQSVASGQPADRPTDPRKQGWEFAGWVTEQNGSTPYAFSDPVTGDTSIYASWVKETAEKLHITATATEGGTIEPEGVIEVTKGGEKTFTITPDEGNRIKAVTVDGSDVTADLADTVTRAQTGAGYYTFTNVIQNHTIHAEFERDGGDNPNPNPDPGGDNPGGGDNPTPGGDGGNTNPGGGSGGSGGGGTGDNSNPGAGGGNSGGGGNSNSGGGNNGGDSTNPDGGNTANPGDGNNAGNTQTAAGTETSSAQAGSNAAGGKEPKTGDTAYWEVYATLAMIAGLTYLLLYVMEESRGMTEREKEAFVAAFIRWGKKGGAFRKCCAMAAIFCLLMYYHTIGKRAKGNALRERYLGQVS